MGTTSTGIIKRNKDIIGVLLATAVILLIPLVAMQFTEEVDWRLPDFIIIGTLLLGTGFTYVSVARKTGSIAKRVVIGVLLMAALLLIWAELAVGIFGTPFAGS